MDTRKQALALAKQLRTCPPPRVKKDPRFQSEVKRHIDICPFCSTDLKNEVGAWFELSESLEKEIKKPGGNARILPGQIRKVDPGFSCWRGDYFYNAPEVLILETGLENGKAVLVAQVWQDWLMAGPEDLVPPGHMVTGVDEVFIEPWNIYTLATDSLGICIGAVGSDVVDQVLKLDENPDDLPDWAMKTMPMVAEDPRIYFRETEIETGFTFSSMAVSILLEEASQSVFSFSIEELKAAVKEKISGISWEWIPDTVGECLAAMSFPSHALPLRAADLDEKVFTANYFELVGEKIIDVKPIECQIIHSTNPPEPYSVSGRIDGLPKDISQDAFQCYVKDSKNNYLYSCNFMWESSGKFMAVFDRTLNPDETLSLVITHYRKTQ